MSLFNGSRIALSIPAFIASTTNPWFTSFLAGRLKEMLDTAPVMWIVGYSALMAWMTSVTILMPSSDVHSISTSGSMWKREGSMPNSLAFAIKFANTSSLLSAVWGMPLSSFKSAATSHPGFAASTGNARSVLSPSMLTELNSPGLLQNGMHSIHTFTLGLSTAIGRSVTSCTRSMSHFIVATSISSDTDAHTSMNVAPAAVCFLASSLMNSPSFAAMAFATEGMLPLIFSPMMIMNWFPPVF